MKHHIRRKILAESLKVVYPKHEPDLLLEHETDWLCLAILIIDNHNDLLDERKELAKLFVQDLVPENQWNEAVNYSYGLEKAVKAAKQGALYDTLIALIRHICPRAYDATYKVPSKIRKQIEAMEARFTDYIHIYMTIGEIPNPKENQSQ